MRIISKSANDNPVGLIKDLIKISDEAMLLKYTNWKIYRKKIRNEEHIVRSTNKEAPLFSSNYLEKKLNTFLSYLADNIPVMSVRGVENEDDDFAIYKQNLIDWMSSNQQINYRQKVMMLGKEIAITGIGYIKIYYDEDSESNDVGVRWEVISPENVKIDPLCGGDINKARWVIHLNKSVPVDKLLYHYQKRDLEPTITTSFDLHDEWKPTEQEGVHGIYDGMATVMECYIKDYTMETIEEVNDEGIVTKNRVRKYPKWRLIIICDGCSKPLYDGNLPYGYEDMPIIPVVYEEDTNTMYPISLIEKVLPLQDKSDQLERQIFKNIRLIVNRQRKLQTNSGLKKSDINSQPGFIYEMTDINGLQWDNPTQLSGDIFRYRDTIPEEINTVSGIYEMAEGRGERGVTAYSAIVTLKDASTATMRRVVSSIEDGLLKAMVISMGLFVANKEEEMLLETLNNDLMIIKDYPETISKYNINGEMETIPIDRAAPEDKINWKMENGIHVVLSEMDIKRDLYISGDNALPSSKAQKARINLELFDRKVIDAETLLEAYDYPGRARIMRRQQQAQEQAMMAQMQQQGMEGLMSQMGGGENMLPESNSVPLLPELQPDRTQEKV